ncbi:MAG: asparagine synthase (glutamine-hydrolyzing) [Blastocatellia bacterium]|nr:asparagine synthase (glutamine-hydrolyzing) [Blastocatellia bacterium]
MCGIAGRFNPGGLSPDPGWRERADERLAHRGPDGRGQFADERCELVHRRLALIDLSPGGAQPMANETGDVQVVFNGEIYNHLPLRQELLARGHRFRGASDTEALVHLYEECGEAMVARLRGMFAFAIYDLRGRSLLLARDRFGIKPLYYAALRDQFVFASEIKAILALHGFAPTLDRQACYDFLGLNYIPEPETGFLEIRALPPGSLLRVTADGVTVARYWRPEPRPEEPGDFARAVNEAGESLQRAVRAQSVADVPVAALLSGGIDSSLVVAASCRTGAESPHTFNIRFPDEAFDETPYALAVAKRFQTRHETIRLEDEAITPELVQRLLAHFDQPFADSSLLPTWFVSKAIRDRGIICTLSGDGGDESFGGYACFEQAQQLARLARWPRAAISAASRLGERLTPHTQDLGRRIAKAFRLAAAGKDDPAMLLAGMLTYVGEEQKRELVAPEAREFLLPAQRWFDGMSDAETSLESLSALLTEKLFTVSLTGAMLRKVDMMSMLAGIEVRVPLLDEAVVDCGLRLPHRFKTDGTTGKRVLRALARQWLPPEVASHRKQCFAIPLDRMATPRFHQMLEDLLLSPDARIRAFLNGPMVEQWVRRFTAARDGATGGDLSREGLYQRIFILLSLELWLREHHLSW